MRRVNIWALALCALAIGSCSRSPRIELHYRIEGIPLEQVVRVETLIAMDSAETRMFFADQPYRSAGTGVGSEVRDFDGSGRRQLLITHDATLGFAFTRDFSLTLLPPVGGEPPPLVVVARAIDATHPISTSAPLSARFAPESVIDIRIQEMRCGGASVCSANQACCDTPQG